MRDVLVLGAGHSAGYLVRRLLERARRRDWRVIVGDRDRSRAARAVGGHERGEAVALDVGDAELLTSHVERAAVVVDLLPQRFQSDVARDCLRHGRHLVSVSYRDRRTAELARDAEREGVLLLTEMGLDPGIDLMSATAMIRRVQDAGGVVEGLESYGSGVPAPEVDSNPLRYCVTWNPRNVAMAGEEGARYLEDGAIRIVPRHRLFQRTWPKQVPGFGAMEAYPNRDSLSYRDTFGIPGARTLIRGTLRYPGWCETWHQIVRLGLPDEHLRIPELSRRSFAEIVEMFLPRDVSGSGLEERVAHYLGIEPAGRVMANLRWLGLFSRDAAGIEGTTAADALIHLLETRLPLPEGGRDAIILLHEVTARYPGGGGRRERVTSTLVCYGEPGGTTAMAKTVGLPAALAVELLLAGELPLSGCPIPTHPAIYSPVLARLEAEGLAFHESAERLDRRQLLY